MENANSEVNEIIDINEVVVGDKKTEINKREKLWSMNFFLLWQGQFVSAMGDVIYEIALGFWILAVTGSTGLMGTLMAASTLPRIIISPFAGVIVDRSDRKKLLVLMDFIRGIVITFVGIAAILGFIKIWMVFAAGVILGICASFFNPSVSSSIPDIVPKSKLMKANSALNMVYTGTNILANPIGGFLYTIVGAPIMFLFNGISYLFSSFTELFIKIPKIERKMVENHFREDLKEGLKFVWNFKVLRNLMLFSAILNFFFSMAMILVLPLFQRNEALGASKYGVAIAVLTGGMFVGMALTSAIDIPYSKRFLIFTISGILMTLSFAFSAMFNYKIMLGLFAIAGFFNAMINVFFSSTMQLTVPQEMRGKVFSLMSITAALTPLSMAIGGILAEFIAIKYIILGCFMLSFIGLIPIICMKDFKKFINFNPDTQTLEDII